MNPYFVFTQTAKRAGYVWSVYTTLQHYCGRFPLWNRAYRKKVFVPFFQVITRSYPYLKNLYDLFYKDLGNGNMTKIITPDILPYMDAICLAYWAMDDGTPSGRAGFYFHTKGFTFNECYLLAGMLHYQFGLICTVQNHTNQPVLYITARSMPTFRAIVTPHFHSTMMHKLYF